MLVINREELENILRPKDVVDAAKDAFIAFSQGKVKQPERQVLNVKGNWWGIMPSYTDKAFSVKVISVINENKSRNLPTVQGTVLLMSPETGETLALIDGTILTAMRTAAASVLSTELTMGRKIHTLGIIGAGTEAYYHAKIGMGYLSVSRLLITARKSHFQLASKVGGEAVDHITLLKESDVIFSTTSSSVPVVLGDYLKDNFHVSSIGAHTPDSREIDDRAISKAKTFLVDSIDAVSREAGDYIQPMKKGLIKNVIEIGKAILEGNKISTPSIFKTVGIAAQDNFASYYAYKAAISRKL
ncbi:ornithine cyclodeaminase [Candidatus Acidianus copahuensis]|uniref:Ornithine cyclodeaminase n=1 Tax=Candidatus Acidianus copahuensis TaxID=1160895 RepID=A0A031LP89_9CREN|nr:ornithine cyclodeaminase family protein [Candidatus Acidianus copahuensis]EZQ06877.1 ornithine cyclodeaminase [Candidatus Acidianus copahuensis]